jgi:hypothetical protein
MLLALLAATVLMADSSTARQVDPATTAAQPEAAVAAPAAKPKKQAKNGLICRNEPVLGSRLPTKRCRTQEQMDAQQQEDQANLDKMQRVGDPGH